VVAGPVLNIPVSWSDPVKQGDPPVIHHAIAHYLPAQLHVDGTLKPETRKRGIYTVVVYEGKLVLKGTFSKPDSMLSDMPGARLNLDGAYFTIGVSDMRGIKNLPELVVNGTPNMVEPGVADTDLFPSGITVRAGAIPPGKNLDFEITLVINGSEDLSVEALGKTSRISMRSDWSEPGFSGAFLPINRQVTSQGFTAEWNVTHLNRNFPQQWINNKFSTKEAQLGVELLIPVDHYQKSMRAIKYAILFIALNFIIFMFIEMRSRSRIHPFQYAMVALALLMFYTLLISISEQIGFNPAYLISAVAVTLLISWYAWSILRQKSLVAWVFLLQTGLYLFLFIILQLQDYALLTGSIGLFIILAVIMRASQKIKWYA
jgi:inner membrane protein